jgi:hypothetical protein
MAMRWGFGVEACHLWAATGLVIPSQWKILFGGDLESPMEIVIIYRELVALGRPEADLAMDIVNLTPLEERREIRGFWLGSESLSTKPGVNTVRETIGKILRRYGLPEPLEADNQRVDGWRFVHNCLRQSKLCLESSITAERIKQGPALFVSDACPKVIENLPQAVASEKDPNDIEAKLDWCAVTDAVRHLLKSKPPARAVPPLAVRRQMVIDAYQDDPTSRHMAVLRFNQENAGKRAVHGPTWRQGLTG